MKTKTFRSLDAAMTEIQKDVAQLEKKVRKAFKETAEEAVDEIRSNVPVAFEELQKSVHLEGMRVIADAPHAASVEVGSRPHTPPLKPLLEWVELRGLPESAARAIQQSIGKHGTKPHWYMKRSIQAVARKLDRKIKEACRS